MKDTPTIETPPEPKSRQEIDKHLSTRPWFKNSPQEIQHELLNLPLDFNGFLQDLLDRPDEIGELDVIRMTKVGVGKFLILPVFEVRSNITNQIFTYEYVSWKTGKFPGMKGIIFLETNNQITHFIVAKQHQFSTATESYEAIGGLYLRIFGDEPQNLPKKIEQEICFHLGIPKVEFKQVYDLGFAHPDYGMSNNMSALFAATIDITDLPSLTQKKDFRLTNKPVGFEIKIFHINELVDLISQIKDNYFLSTIARILASKDFKLNLPT